MAKDKKSYPVGKFDKYQSLSTTRRVREKKRVSSHSIEVIKAILRSAGVESATITSTARDPKAQATAMYRNLASICPGKGVDDQKKLYGPSGKEVIEVYVRLTGNEEGKDEIIEAMRKKIVEKGRIKCHTTVWQTLRNSTLLTSLQV